jgi:hypothetical protein
MDDPPPPARRPRAVVAPPPVTDEVTEEAEEVDAEAMQALVFELQAHIVDLSMENMRLRRLAGREA